MEQSITLDRLTDYTIRIQQHPSENTLTPVTIGYTLLQTFIHTRLKNKG